MDIPKAEILLKEGFKILGDSSPYNDDYDKIIYNVRGSVIKAYSIIDNGNFITDLGSNEYDISHRAMYFACVMFDPKDPNYLQINVPSYKFSHCYAVTEYFQMIGYIPKGKNEKKQDNI